MDQVSRHFIGLFLGLLPLIVTIWIIGEPLHWPTMWAAAISAVLCAAWMDATKPDNRSCRAKGDGA